MSFIPVVHVLTVTFNQLNASLLKKSCFFPKTNKQQQQQQQTTDQTFEW